MSIYNESIIIEEYLKGKTQKHIASELGTYNTTIRRILKRNGIPLRGNDIIQNYVKINYFEDVTNPEVQYWIGWLISDGCLTNNSVVLTLSEKDKYILEEYSQFLGGKPKVNFYINKKYNIKEWYVKFKNKEIYTFLKSLGITERKSASIKLNIPISYNIFRGIFEGDGYIRKNNIPYVSIVTASEGLKNQLVDFLTKENFSPIVKASKRSKDRLLLYNISLYKKEELYSLYNNMYKDVPTKLIRKWERFGPLLKKFNN